MLDPEPVLQGDHFTGARHSPADPEGGRVAVYIGLSDEARARLRDLIDAHPQPQVALLYSGETLSNGILHPGTHYDELAGEASPATASRLVTALGPLASGADGADQRPPEAAIAAQAEADAACRAATIPSFEGLTNAPTLMGAFATSAGTLDKAGESSGTDWSSYPADHFVASCTFRDHDVESTSATCPDSPVHGYLVDRKGLVVESTFGCA